MLRVGRKGQDHAKGGKLFGSRCEYFVVVSTLNLGGGPRKTIYLGLLLLYCAIQVSFYAEHP